MEAIDPRWSEELDLGRIQDPLQLDTVRNKVLSDLLWGITSIQIYQRLRYISFFLWCLDNLENPSKDDLVPFEKIFLLANIAHEHRDEKNRGTNGLSGSSNVPWSSDELRESENDPFSITAESFKIQDSGSSGFSQYYKSIMARLLLTDRLSPTPLGRQVADAFDAAVDVDFEEVQEAVDEHEVSQDLLTAFAEGACCCLLDGQEEEFLRKAYFGLITPATGYEDLSFTDREDAPELNLDVSISDADVLSLLDVPDEVVDVDDYLDRFFGGNFGAKMRESFLLFLWIAANRDRGTGYELSHVPRFGDIREMWRLFLFYEYLNYGCEALLSGVLWPLRTSGPVQPDDLLERIVSNDMYRETVQAVLDELRIEDGDGALGALDSAFQHIYYGDAVETDVTVTHDSVDKGFEGSWTDLMTELESRIDPGSYRVDDAPAEWMLKRLTKQQLRNRSGPAIDVSSRIFAYVTVLFAVLKVRHRNYSPEGSREQYWSWLSNMEDRQPGPVSLINALDGDGELASFFHSFSRQWVIDRYHVALYDKMDTSRMPRLFSRDFTGRIDFQEWRKPTLTLTKFERMADILYDLGLLESGDVNDFELTDEGHDWLKQFVEVEA